jgi:hypothetical protein
MIYRHWRDVQAPSTPLFIYTHLYIPRSCFSVPKQRIPPERHPKPRLKSKIQINRIERRKIQCKQPPNSETSYSFSTTFLTGCSSIAGKHILPLPPTDSNLPSRLHSPPVFSNCWPVTARRGPRSSLSLQPSQRLYSVFGNLEA